MTERDGADIDAQLARNTKISLLSELIHEFAILPIHQRGIVGHFHNFCPSVTGG